MSGYSTTHVFKKHCMQTKATVLDALRRASWKKKKKKKEGPLGMTEILKDSGESLNKIES